MTFWTGWFVQAFMQFSNGRTNSADIDRDSRSSDYYRDKVINNLPFSWLQHQKYVSQEHSQRFTFMAPLMLASRMKLLMLLQHCIKHHFLYASLCRTTTVVHSFIHSLTPVQLKRTFRTHSQYTSVGRSSLMHDPVHTHTHRVGYSGSSDQWQHAVPLCWVYSTAPSRSQCGSAINSPVSFSDSNLACWPNSR